MIFRVNDVIDRMSYSSDIFGLYLEKMILNESQTKPKKPNEINHNHDRLMVTNQKDLKGFTRVYECKITMWVNKYDHACVYMKKHAHICYSL